MKKYYWLKLERNFFKRHDIRIIEDMPNGKEYVLFFMKILVESIDHEGKLRFNELIPYNDQMLATITNTNIDIVRSAIKLFQSLNLLELWDDQTIYVNDTAKMLGEKSEWAVKKAEWRAKQIEEKTNVGQKKDNVRQEKEIEKEIELDIDKDSSKKRVHKFTQPTLEEVSSYCLERKNKVNPQKFINYYDSNGWKVGRNKMKDWKATIRTWETNDYDKNTKVVDIPSYYNEKDDDVDKKELLRKLKEQG
jgi:predicted phage replisome organizer